MTLANRKRIGSTLRNDNFEFVTNLSEHTGINQSKMFDLAIDILRDKLNNENIIDLINQYKHND